jgi:hypothetical protein
VNRNPALALADVEQEAVNSFFCAGPGVKVVRQQFINIVKAVVDDNLLSVKMCMPERRGKIDHDFRLENPVIFIYICKILQIGKAGGKEPGVFRRDQSALIPVFIAAHHNRDDDQVLRFQPIECFPPEGLKVFAELILIPRLIRRFIIADDQAVGIPPAHIHIRIIDNRPVFAACDDRFRVRRPVYVILNGKFVFTAERQLNQFVFAFWDGYALAAADNFSNFI